MYACEENSIKVVKELLEGKPNLNLVNQKVLLAHSFLLSNTASVHSAQEAAKEKQRM